MARLPNTWMACSHYLCPPVLAPGTRSPTFRTGSPLKTLLHLPAPTRISVRCSQRWPLRTSPSVPWQDSSPSPQPTASPSKMDTAQSKPGITSRHTIAPTPLKYRPTAAFQPATAAPEPHPSKKIVLRGFNSYRRRRKGTSPHMFALFLGRISATTAECRDTLSWTPCTGPLQSTKSDL